MDSTSIIETIKLLGKVLGKEKSLRQNNPFLNETKEEMKKLTKEIRTTPIEISYQGKVLTTTTIRTLGGESDVLLSPKMKHYRDMPVAISFIAIQWELMGVPNSEFLPKEIDVKKYSFMFKVPLEHGRLKQVEEDVVLVRAGVRPTELYKVYHQFETLGAFLNYLVRFKEHVESVSGLRL